MINILVPFLPKDKVSYEGKFFKEIILGLEDYSKEQLNVICIEFIKSKNISFNIDKIYFLREKCSSIWIKYSLPIKPTEVGLNFINTFIFLYLIILNIIKLKKHSKIIFLSLWRSSFIYFLLRALNYKKILVYELLGYPLEKNNPNYNLALFISYFFKIENFISTSNYLLNKFKIKSKKKYIVPNIIPDIFIKDPPKSYPENIINIIWIGRLEEIKRPLLAIDIYKSVITDKGIKNKITLNIIGNGSLNKKVKRYINFINNQNSKAEINYLDKLSPKEIIEKLDKSHILLHTSTHESYGMVYAEALARNLNIVTTTPGCLVDINFKKYDSKIKIINKLKTKDIIYEVTFEIHRLIRDISKNKNLRPNFNSIIKDYSSKRQVIKNLLNIL